MFIGSRLRRVELLLCSGLGVVFVLSRTIDPQLHVSQLSPHSIVLFFDSRSGLRCSMCSRCHLTVLHTRSPGAAASSGDCGLD